MTGRVDTAEGRRLMDDFDDADNLNEERRSMGFLKLWLLANADGLLAAAEERDTLREALERIADPGGEADRLSRFWWSDGREGAKAMLPHTIARAALAAVEARLGEPA